MKSKIFLLTFTSLIGLVACDNKAPKDRLKTIYQISKLTFNGKEETFKCLSDTFHYAQDGTRDFNMADGTGKEERIDNVIEWKSYNQAGKEINSRTTYLNEQGLEDSVVTKSDNQLSNAHKYLYDAAGNLIEDRDYNPSFHLVISKYKVIDGNRTEETVINIPGTDTLIRSNETGEAEQVITKYEDVILHHEYFPDKLNVPRNEITGISKPDKESKNLHKKSVQLTGKGDTVDVFSFRYNYDSKGRVLAKIQEARSGEYYDSTSYTYY